MQEEIENHISGGSQKISDDIATSLEIRRQGDGERIETLERAVRNLVDFVHRGGEVDCVLPAEIEVQDPENPEETQVREDPTRRELATQFASVRALTKEVKQQGLMTLPRPANDD